MARLATDLKLCQLAEILAADDLVGSKSCHSLLETNNNDNTNNGYSYYYCCYFLINIINIINILLYTLIFCKFILINC